MNLKQDICENELTGRREYMTRFVEIFMLLTGDRENTSAHYSNPFYIFVYKSKVQSLLI